MLGTSALAGASEESARIGNMQLQTFDGGRAKFITPPRAMRPDTLADSKASSFSYRFGN